MKLSIWARKAPAMITPSGADRMLGSIQQGCCGSMPCGQILCRIHAGKGIQP